jgi:hypothetical protein
MQKIHPMTHIFLTKAASVFIRSMPDLFLKQTGKMLRIFKAQIVGNLANRFTFVKNSFFYHIDQF